MKKILLLLPKGAELLEIAAFTDVFGWDKVCGEKSCQLLIAGASREVRLSFGHTMLADLLWSEVAVEDFSALAVPGGFPRYGYFRCCGEEPLSLIRQFHQAGKPIAAVCTGSLLLGRAGVLAGRRAATYCSPDTPFQQELAELGALVKDAPLVEDGNLLTGAGPGAAARVALALLARCSNEDNSRRIKNLMEL